MMKDIMIMIIINYISRLQEILNEDSIKTIAGIKLFQ